MENTRSLFELWLIVQNNFERIYDTFRTESGICNVINVLVGENALSNNEARILKRVLAKYAHIRGRAMRLYIWNPEARKPRRLFIHRQIIKEIRKDAAENWLKNREVVVASNLKYKH